MTSLRPSSKPELLEPLASKQEGTKVMLECKWSDHTRVSWLRNDIPIFSTKDMSVTQTRSACLLTIHRANRDHNGQYTCVASNIHGKTLTQCQLAVQAAFEGKPYKIGKLNGSVMQFEGVSNHEVRKPNTNTSPFARASRTNGTPSHPSPQQKNVSVTDSSPQFSRSKASPLQTNIQSPSVTPSRNNELVSGRSNLQSARLRSISNKTPQTNEVNTNSTPSANLRFPVTKEPTKKPTTDAVLTKTPSQIGVQSNQVSWKVKGPSSVFKPVSFEVAVPASSVDQSDAEREKRSSAFTRSNYSEPREQKTPLSEASRLSPVDAKKIHIPSNKIAAVALLSSRLQAAQMKESTFIAMREGLKPVSKSPVVHKTDASPKPVLEKSKSEEWTRGRKELRSVASLDTSTVASLDISTVSPAYKPKQVSTMSASSSLSDVSSDSTGMRSTPPKKISTVSSIKDRVAKFSSSENLATAVPSYLKRSNGEINRPLSVQTSGIETQSRGSKLIASENDQSRDSSADRSQSYRALSPIGNSGQSVSTAQSAPSDKLRRIKEKIEGSSAPKSWRASLNNNNNDKTKSVQDSASDMKLKVSSYSSGLKTTPLRTTLPIFTSKLRNHYGRQGDALKLHCRVDGEPKPVVSWHKEGKPLLENQRIKIYNQSGTYYFEIISSLKEDSGRYTVEAVNSKATILSSADVEIAGRKTNVIEQKAPKQSTSSFRPSSTVEEKSKASHELNKQVDKFHSEANDMMAELDSFTPRSTINGHVTHSSHCSPPSFTLDLKDCAVEEGERFDLQCTTQGEDSGLEHSPPQFVKILHDEVVNEGDSVTITCKSPHDDDQGMKASAPKFTQNLSDHVLTEGDSLTIEVHGSHDYHQTAPPRFVKELQDEVVEEGESVTIECKSPHHASITGAPVFVEKLHDVVVEEGDSLTLECLSPYSRVEATSQCTPPTFVTKLQDQQVVEGDTITIECKGPTDHAHSHSYKTEYTSPASPSLSPHSHPMQTLQSNTQHTNGISPPKFVKNLVDYEVEEGDQLTISCKTPLDSSSPSYKPVFVKSLSEEVEVEEGKCVIISCTSQQIHAEPQLLSPPKFVKELKDEQVNEGESLVIQRSQVAPLNASLNSHTDDSVSLTDDSPSQPATQPPSIYKELSDVEITVGQQAELMMETAGSLPMDIVWVHNEDELNPEDSDYIQVSDGHVHRLLITAAFPEDSGTYICEAYNDCGEADSACELHVLEDLPEAPEPEKPLDLTPNILEMLPDALTITDDSTVKLVCRISNVQPEDVNWSKNERMARKGSRFKTLAEGDVFSYTISSCMSIDKGLYTVTASNKHGEVSSCCNITYSTDNPDIILDSRKSVKSARLAVRAASMTTPKFSKGLGDITVTEMECTTFECKVDANPTATLQWLSNGKEIKPSSTFEMTLDSGLARLTIKNIQLADQGRYTAIATNDAGSDKTSCFLNVQKPIVKPEGSVPEAPIGKPTVIDISSQGATVTWHGPSFDGGAMVQGYKVEMCKASLLNISPTKYWKTLINLCKSMSYRVTQMTTSHEFVFRIRAVNSIGEGPPSEMSDPVLATDRRESTRSISTIGDSESVDYSEYSDYPESEYDPELDEAFLEHDVIITKERKLDDQYDIVEELGKGKFGLVYLVIDKSTKRQWAAKKIKCRASQKPDIMNEVDVMNTLRHPKLVRLWEVFDHGREMVLIQEYVGGGELFERIVDDDFELKESDCIRFMKQICDGIAYMHSKAVVHLDLKPENVMCVSKHSNQIKLIDFGLARKFKPGDNMKVLFGTPEFVAPEVINYDPVGFNTDMWSVGVITYVLLSGLSPFMGDNDSETLSNVTMTQWDFEDDAFDEISEAAKDFISQLLVKKLEKRLNAVEALRHPWLHDTTKQKHTQTLSKSKSKMKKFLARRKWQKTFKAMVAITRMRSSFFKLNSKENLLASPASSTSPHELAIAEDLEEKKLCASPPSPTEKGDDTPTPTQSPMVITSYDEALSPGEGLSCATPTIPNKSIFDYPKVRDRKFCESETGSDENTTCQVSPPAFEIDKDQMSDTKDSGYEGRKSTREIITDGEDNFTEGSISQPIFLQPLPEEIHVIEGDCARFDVEIEANPTPKVVWLRDHEPVVITDRIELEIEGHKYSLILRDITLNDDAEYECRAANEHGENSTFGELYVVSNA